MSALLEGKTALVTGAGKRIGREIAIALAREGADIVVHYRSSLKEATELSSELAKSGVKVWLVQADFEKRGHYEHLIKDALDRAGKLDILVNSASIFPPEKFAEMTFEGLVRALEVNAWVPYVLARDFAKTAGNGKIINLLDSRITGYDLSHASYILSKHVLAVLTHVMAVMFAPDITVNAIAPGLILPPPGKDSDYLEGLVYTVPLRRHGNPPDIAKAALYLATSDFVTGETLFVDGGRHLKEYSI